MGMFGNASLNFYFSILIKNIMNFLKKIKHEYSDFFRIIGDTDYVDTFKEAMLLFVLPFVICTPVFIGAILFFHYGLNDLIGTSSCSVLQEKWWDTTILATRIVGFIYTVVFVFLTIVSLFITYFESNEFARKLENTNVSFSFPGVSYVKNTQLSNWMKRAAINTFDIILDILTSPITEWVFKIFVILYLVCAIVAAIVIYFLHIKGDLCL